MNSVERVFIALRRGVPDRVPVLEFLVDPGIAAAAVSGSRDVADAMDRLDMDGVGCGAAFAVTECFPDGSWRDEWGVVYQGNAETVPHPVRGPVGSRKDAQNYTPPAAETPERLAKLRDLVARYKGKRAICFHHRAAFMWSAYLRGLDNLLMDFVLDPELVEVLFDKVLAVNMAIVRNAIRAGAEVIVLGDDYAFNKGPLMSPEDFSRFIQPRLTRMIAMIHEEGAFCVKHSDGNLYPILDRILDAGPDGLNPIEPVAGMDLKTVKRLAGDRVCLVGNIDCAHLLPHGSPEEVREAVRQAIADAAPGGGFILSSSNSIHSSCRPENLIAMVRAAHEFGAY